MTAERYNIIYAAIILAVTMSGCDDTIISPFSDREANYSIFGYIATDDTHYVRIVPIRNTLDRDVIPVQLDASVTTTNEATGRVDEWSQLLPVQDDGSRGLLFSDSTYGHVFRAIFPVNPGESYTFRVNGFDGDSVSARVSVPFISEPRVEDIVVDNGRIVQTLVIPDLGYQPFAVGVLYVLASDIFNAPRIGIWLYNHGVGTVDDDGVRIEMDLAEDVQLLRKEIVDNLNQYATIPVVEDPQTFTLYLLERRARVFAGDSTWNFISANPDLGRLAQPGAHSNVEGGFGFFGALGTNFAEMPITDSQIRQQIGFTQ